MGWGELWDAKKFDIGLTVVSTLVGLVLGLIIDLLRDGSSKKDASSSTSTSPTEVHISINNIQQAYVQQFPQSSQRGSKSNEESVFWMLLFAAFSVGIFYLFFKSEILNLATYSALCVLGAWSGLVLYSLVKGVFVGTQWIMNFLLSLLFCFFIIVIVDKAISPDIAAPKNFPYVQQIINEFGIPGLSRFFSLHDFKWLTFHFLGIVLLFLVQLRMIFSVIFFASMTLYVSGIHSEMLLRLARKTAKYQQVYKNILVTSALLFLSYLLVSGDFFSWFENELPRRMGNIIHLIFNGRH